jgi:DNA-binding MurR/RpiR family transcriptional regulator
MTKLYTSEKWLRHQYLRQRKSPEEIAEMCGVSHMTIYRAINKFGLKR